MKTRKWISGLSFSALLGASLTLMASEAQAKRYVVKVKEGSSSDISLRQATRSSNRQALASELKSLSKAGHAPMSFARTGFVVLEANSDEEAKAALTDHPLVEYFEQDIEWKTFSTDDGSAPSSQTKAPWLNDVLGLDQDAPAADVTYTGDSPVLVAVVDTGINIAHPFLQSALAANSADQGAALSTSAGDHGTHVAGLVKIVRDQAIPLYPQAKAVQLLPIRFIDSNGTGSTSGAISALEYAASRGVKVINASWGARGQDAFSRALYDTMVELYKQDIVITVAAGNAEGLGPNNNDVTPYFPANFAIPSLLSVASVTPAYELGSGNRRVFTGSPISDFSNYGRATVDLAAPGSFTDVWGDSSGVYSANSRYVSPMSLYVRKRGTSMAAPVVAGVAGVVRAINPSLTAFEVKTLLMSTAHTQAGLAVKSEGVVDGDAAFVAASNARSSGDHGQLSSTPYSQSATSSDPRDVGGCGAIATHGSGEGPLGGNGLGLVTLGYLVAYLARALVRQRQRKNSARDSVIQSVPCSTRF